MKKKFEDAFRIKKMKKLWERREKIINKMAKSLKIAEWKENKLWKTIVKIVDARAAEKK